MKKSNWKIIKNTDSVDIRESCLGLSPKKSSIPQDVADHIHSNRGLHIQIRHNKDPQTYAQACDLASLISCASEMLDVLDDIHTELVLQGDYLDEELFLRIDKIIKKARKVKK